MQSNRIPSFHTTIANDVVIKLLQRNHIEHHILWREGFHNHFPHVLLTNYALGANEKIFQQEWERESQYLEPIGERKQEKITPDNFTEFLGQAEYYRNFLHFFEDQILNHPGASAEIFYHYFFHKSVFPSVLSGAVHPLIHLGFAIEFESDKVLAEGLALACIQKPTVAGMIKFLNEEESSPQRKLPLIELLEEVRHDRDIARYVNGKSTNKWVTTFNQPVLVEKINQYASQYDFGEETSENVAHRLQEIYEGAMIAYGTTVFHPFSKNCAVNTQNIYNVVKPDFFLLHGLTSALSLLQITPILTNKQAKQLLRGHVAMLIFIYISRGRPKMHVNLMKDYPIPSEISGWNDIIRLAISSTDIHVAKVIRSLILGNAFLSNKMIQTGMINTDELPNDDTSLAYRIACMTIDELVIRKKPWEMDGAGYKETWAHLGFSEHPAHDVID